MGAGEPYFDNGPRRSDPRRPNHPQWWMPLCGSSAIQTRHEEQIARLSATVLEQFTWQQGALELPGQPRR